MPPVGRQSAVRIARPKKWLDTAGLLMEVADKPDENPRGPTFCHSGGLTVMPTRLVGPRQPCQRMTRGRQTCTPNHRRCPKRDLIARADRFAREQGYRDQR